MVRSFRQLSGPWILIILRIPYKTLALFSKTKLSKKKWSLDSPPISDLDVHIKGNDFLVRNNKRKLLKLLIPSTFWCFKKENSNYLNCKLRRHQNVHGMSSLRSFRLLFRTRKSFPLICTSKSENRWWIQRPFFFTQFLFSKTRTSVFIRDSVIQFVVERK